MSSCTAAVSVSAPGSSSSASTSAGAQHAHLFVFSGSNKAGMSGYDKAKQAEIIYESSKDSNYFKHALAQDKKTDERISKMQEKVRSMSQSQTALIKKSVIKDRAELESKRDFGRICCVLDMDMFFAAVEIRDRPELADKPVAVGSLSMISTANYVARQFGVRSAMPGFIAKKLW